MPHPLCQIAAKSWVKNCTSPTIFELMGVYDRMFQFRLINSPLSPGTEKVGSIVVPGSADEIVLVGYYSQLMILSHERLTRFTRRSGMVVLYITPCNQYDSCYARCIASRV
jgi:hypothetical protein